MTPSPRAVYCIQPVSGRASHAIDRVITMTRLVLINGSPGSGKSTLADGLAQDRPMTLALDVDVIKHSLGRWSDDLLASGPHARRLSLALAREQLSAGYDVVLGQYWLGRRSLTTSHAWPRNLMRSSSSSFSTSTPLRLPSASTVDQVPRPVQNTWPTTAWSAPATPSFS